MWWTLSSVDRGQEFVAPLIKSLYPPPLAGFGTTVGGHGSLTLSAKVQGQKWGLAWWILPAVVGGKNSPSPGTSQISFCPQQRSVPQQHWSIWGWISQEHVNVKVTFSDNIMTLKAGLLNFSWAGFHFFLKATRWWHLNCSLIIFYWYYVVLQ